MDENQQQQETARLHIRTMGEFALFERQGTAWVRIVDKVLFSRGPSLTLLKVLICQGLQLESAPFLWKHHKASRDLLIDSMWSEEEAERINTLRSLQTAKCVVNSALRSCMQGADVIALTEASDGLTYELNRSYIEIDVDRFEQQVALASRVHGHGEEAQTAWEAALLLYQGTFLPDDRYNDWSRRREQIAAKYRLVLHQLAQIASARGEIAQAILYVHPYVLAHPQDEDALCLLLPLLAQQERFLEAFSMVESTRRVLEEEGRVLSKATQRLVEHVQQAHESMYATGMPSSPLALPASSQKTPALLAGKILTPSLWLPQGRGHDTRWFDLKQAEMVVIVEQWMGRATECGTLQAILSQEIAMFEHMKTPHETTYRLSRRQALEALIVFPTALLTALQQGQMSNPLIDRFLPYCAAGITSCWHLINDGDFATVQRAIFSYLPHLEIIVQQSDPYRATAAHLAAQSYVLVGLVALHRGSLAEKEIYARKAVKYAQESGDSTLLLQIENGLAYTLYAQKKSHEALQLWQKVEAASIYSLPFLHSNILIKLAAAYGQTNHRQEALRCIGEAQALFPETSSAEIPLYLTGDFGPVVLMLWEGITRLELGQHTLYGEDYQQAEQIFAGIGTLATTTAIPERFRLQVLNNQAETALRLEQLEAFCTYLEQGIQGAQALGSQKRLQEAITLYKTVRQPTHKWRNESRVRDLSELFIP